MTYISNARMYGVCPEAEEAWKALIQHVADDAEVALDYVAYPAPQPLETLWRRPDLGCVQMCGYPIALGVADVVPLAAPIPSADWAGGRAVYRTDLVVRADSRFATLAETFGGTAGWTVAHSQSGFNAFRHHLLQYRNPSRPSLYARTVGNLVTARRILDSVLDGTIDVGPLDAYWHMLIARHRPELTAGIRIVESTGVVPMPAFVAAPSMPAAEADRLRAALVAARSRPWFAGIAKPLLIEGFEAVGNATYAPTLAWHQAAEAAQYPEPA